MGIISSWNWDVECEEIWVKSKVNRRRWLLEMWSWSTKNLFPVETVNIEFTSNLSKPKKSFLKIPVFKMNTPTAEKV